MKYLVISLLILSLFQNISPMEQPLKHLCESEKIRTIIQECDDTKRWIRVGSELFDDLLATADQCRSADKDSLIELKKRIVRGIIFLGEREVLLTQKEFLGGIVQYLPCYCVTRYANSTHLMIHFNNKPTLLKLGPNFWNPNDVKIIQ